MICSLVHVLSAYLPGDEEVDGGEPCADAPSWVGLPVRNAKR